MTQQNAPADVSWGQAFESETGERIVSLSPASGGDIAQSFCAQLGSGGRVFVKHYPPSDVANETSRGVALSPAEAEAAGLK